MKRKKNKKLVKNEKLVAGWLSPSGEYFRLESEHMIHEDLAREILKGRKYRNKYHFDLAMNILLDRKWALIRDKTFCFPKMSYFVGWGLTVEQKHFLKPYIEDGEIVEADTY